MDGWSRGGGPAGSGSEREASEGEEVDEEERRASYKEHGGRIQKRGKKTGAASRNGAGAMRGSMEEERSFERRALDFGVRVGRERADERNCEEEVSVDGVEFVRGGGCEWLDMAQLEQLAGAEPP